MPRISRASAEVAGVFAADAQTDGRYLFTSLRLAQELFSYPDRASAAVVRVARGARPAEVKRRVAEAAGGAFEVRTRDELNASFYTIMQYASSSFRCWCSSSRRSRSWGRW